MSLAQDVLVALSLLIAANASPVLVAKVLRTESLPLDFGYVMPDGERLFGSHKTWRGLLFGTSLTEIVAAFFGLPPWLGIQFALLSLGADAASSAIKRRLHLKPGAEILGLDQLGEALLPLVVLATPLALEKYEIALTAVTFIVLDTMTAQLRHRPWFNGARSRKRRPTRT